MGLRNIQVVHVVNRLSFGGIERLVYDLTLNQKNDKNLSPEVLVLRKGGEFLTMFETLGVTITLLNLKWSYAFSWKTIKIIRNVFHRVDIIHLHGFHIVISLLAIIAKKKIVFTEHGNFAFGRKIKILDRVNHFFRKLFFKYSAHLVACNSKFTKKYINKEWGIKNNRIQVVHNGSNTLLPVDKKKVYEIKKIYKGSFLVGTTSRLAGFKNINRLVQAFKIFSRNKNDVCLIIVGDGPEKRKIELEAGKHLNQNIFLTGYQSNPQDYQKTFDVCVFPSKKEPFGLVAVESYSVGTPVVVFRDGGGLTEIVSECCPEDIVDDIEGLVDRLEYYYRNRNVKLDTAKILNYFTVDRMARDYLKHYKRLLCVE